MIILGEDSQRTSGQDAWSMNTTAGKAVAEVVCTTLGPKGMDKMLVGFGGQVVVTSNGVTILEEVNIGHLAAGMIVEVSETQEDEVGDGTTVAAINADELLDQAEDPLDPDVHVTTIAQGYHQAAGRAKEVPEDNTIEVTEDNRETLTKIAATTMTGKGAGSAKGLLSGLVIDAVLAVRDDDGTDMNNVSTEKVVGGTIDNPELAKGVIVDKERVDENMPYAVEDADIAILDDTLEVRETEIDAEVNVMDPDQLQQLLDQEGKQLKEVIDQLVEVGADAVFVGDGIDDMAQHYLAKEGILAVRRAKPPDLKCLACATGGRVASSLDDIRADDPGLADSVGQKDVGGDECIFIEDVEDVKSVALIPRGGTGHTVNEFKRAIEDSLGVARTMFEDSRVLLDGGAPETEFSLQLRESADSVGSREQLVVEAFAEALDIIPRTLVKNAGLGPIDPLVDLRSRHDGGEFAADLDVYAGEAIDMEERGVAKPLRVKTQAIESATEVAVMILRIDDVIVAGDPSGGQTGSDDDDDGASGGIGGGVGGMGGMGDMGGAMWAPQ